MNQSATTVNSDGKLSYLSYTVDESTLEKTVETITTKTYERPNDFKIAHTMANKIKEYDNKYIIIIVSNNAWELNFSK